MQPHQQYYYAPPIAISPMQRSPQLTPYYMPQHSTPTTTTTVEYAQDGNGHQQHHQQQHHQQQHHHDDQDQQQRQEMDPARYKTELCRKFTLTGFCRYAESCQFAHGPQELRALVRHPLYKTSACKSFQETGTCRYGARCRFIHDESPDMLVRIERGVPSLNFQMQLPTLEEVQEAQQDAVTGVVHVSPPTSVGHGPVTAVLRASMMMPTTTTTTTSGSGNGYVGPTEMPSFELAPPNPLTDHNGVEELLPPAPADPRHLPVMTIHHTSGTTTSNSNDGLHTVRVASPNMSRTTSQASIPRTPSHPSLPRNPSSLANLMNSTSHPHHHHHNGHVDVSTTTTTTTANRAQPSFPTSYSTARITAKPTLSPALNMSSTGSRVPHSYSQPNITPTWPSVDSIHFLDRTSQQQQHQTPPPLKSNKSPAAGAGGGVAAEKFRDGSGDGLVGVDWSTVQRSATDTLPFTSFKDSLPDVRETKLTSKSYLDFTFMNSASSANDVRGMSATASSGSRLSIFKNMSDIDLQQRQGGQGGKDDKTSSSHILTAKGKKENPQQPVLDSLFSHESTGHDEGDEGFAVGQDL